MAIRTYISLFSSAGVGCYGFKINGFQCVATNELIKQRIDVQKANKKCKYQTGYICGDATDPEIHKLIFKEIDMWKEKENLQQVDVIFATPPCQGMSTVNYKKNDREQIRNSLVVQAIKLIKEIHPKIFVFENVRAFMKSICTDISGEDMTIRESIFKNLSDDYEIYWKIINFKDYGVPSSRPRTIVIGTSKNLLHTTPLLLFPTRQKEIPLKDSIGGFRRLAYCEKDKTDPLHFARPFPEYMLDWIKDLKEGETAFDNPDETKPSSFDKNGNRVVNKGAYMGNKYRRLTWDKPCSCIATRNDILSSQDTLHPCDNRVLSIRELMVLMTIPNSFRWSNDDASLTVENSGEYLKKHEGNIRRCIGEAVPTHIISDIAGKIANSLDYEDYTPDKPSAEKTSNYFISVHDNYCEFLPKDSFYEIMGMDQNDEKVYINFIDIRKALHFIPQICSYFSHSDSIQIGITNTINSLTNILKMIPLGNNAIMNIISDENKKIYISIENMKKKVQQKTKQQCSVQLSLPGIFQ